MRPCRDCGEVQTPQGGRCDGCRQEYQRQYREKRRKTHPDYFKDYYQRNREQRKKQSLERSRKNPEENRRRAREWRTKNPERAKEQTRQKWEADPERYATYVRDGIRRRRARLADLFVADVREAEIILRDQGICGICGEPVMGPLHLDHVIPVAAGGTHEPDNIQLAHPTCNQRKGARA